MNAVVLPRGIRNNNPGNLDFIAPPEKPWNGQTGSDGTFGVYATAALGVRAMSHQLQKDYFISKADTLAELITEWAPPSGNNTAAYIIAVSSQTGIASDALLNLHDVLPELVAAIIQHENGQQPYAMSDLETWVYL